MVTDLTRLAMVIISKYRQIPNQYVVQLKLIKCYIITPRVF